MDALNASNALHLVHRRPWHEMYDILTTPGQFCIAMDESEICLVVKVDEGDNIFLARILKSHDFFILEGFSTSPFYQVDHLINYYCCLGIEAGRSRNTLVRLRRPVYSAVPTLQYLAGVVLHRVSYGLQTGEVPRYVLEDLSRHNGSF